MSTRRPRNIDGLQLATFIVLASITSSTAAAGPASTPKRGGILTYAVVADTPTYDCHAGNSIVTIDYLAPHYSTLLRIDPARYPQIVGDLADSWEIKDDGRTYVFHLHPNVHFHDDTVLTAADVKASFDRIRHPPIGVISVRQAQLVDISSIETPDDDTIVFRATAPDTSLLTEFASPWNCIYSAKLMVQNPNYPSKVVMGSGPYRFIEHVAGSRWIGRRFEHYF